MNLKLAFGTFVGAAVLGIGIWMSQDSSQTTSLTDVSSPSTDVGKQALSETSTSDAATSAPTCDAVSQWQWQPNTRKMYQFQTHIQVQTDVMTLMSAMFGQQPQANQTPVPLQKTELSLKGLLNFRVFDVQQEQTYVGVQLDQVQIQTEGLPIDDLKALYQTFFLVELSPAGQVIQTYFPPSIQDIDQKSLSGMIAPLQLVLSQKTPPPASWETQESDSLGTYVAQHQYTSHACPQIKKSKSKYAEVTSMNESPLAGDGELQTDSQIHESQWLFQVQNATQWIHQVDGFEKVSLTHKGKAFMTYEVGMELHPKAFEPKARLDIWKETRSALEIIDAWNSSPRVASSRVQGWDDLKMKEMRYKYRSTQAKDFQETFDEYTRLGKGMSDKAPIIQRLEEMLRAYPERSLEIPDLIKANPSKSVSASLILGLEEAGHAEAQQALVQIMEDSEHGIITHLQAIAAAGGLDEPEPWMETVLWNISEEFQSNPTPESSDRSNSALLALGSISSQYAKQGRDNAASEVVNTLGQRLEQSSKLTEQSSLIAALGNSGAANLPTMLDPYLNSKKVSLRKTALRSLRNVKTQKGYDTLLKHLDEPSSEVRQVVFDTLKHKPAQKKFVQKVANQAQKETSKTLKGKMISYLGKNKKETPEAQEALEEMLKKASSEEEFRRIYSALQ